MLQHAQVARLPLLVTVLLGVMFASLPAHAQGGVGVPVIGELSIPWDLPSTLCSGTAPCGRDIRINENNTLYMNAVGGLLAYPPDGSAPTLYSLPPEPMTGQYKAFLDWEPMGDDTILLFRPNSPRSYGFSLWNLETSTIEDIDLPIDFEICAPSFGSDLSRGFRRVGFTDRVIGCTSHAVYLIDIATGSLETIIEWPTYEGTPDPLRRPWGEIVGGLDGRVYISTSVRSYRAFLQQLFPGIDAYPLDTALMLRYSPESQVLDFIAIPHIPRRSELEGASYLSGGFVGVDEAGNLYFYTIELDGRLTPPFLVDAFKVTSDGNLEWHITENELGGTPAFIQLLGENRFALFDTFAGTVVRVEVKEVPITSFGPNHTHAVTDDDGLLISDGVTITVQAADSVRD